MPQYVPSWERIAREEGSEESMEFAVLTLLNTRFESLPEDAVETIRAMNTDQLKDLFTFITVARDWDAIASHIDSLSAT